MDFFSITIKNYTEANRGFTLLEMMVAIAVFSLVVLAAVGILINVFAAQSKAIALKDVLDNTRFALELMTREMRTGSDIKYTTVPPPGCPGNGLEFTSYNQGSAQERFYYWADTDGDGSPDAIMRVAMPSAGSVDCSAVKPEQFTSGEVVVSQWVLRLEGNATGPQDGQSRVTIGFTVYSRNPRFGLETSSQIQTTVVQRTKDF